MFCRGFGLRATPQTQIRPWPLKDGRRITKTANPDQASRRRRPVADTLFGEGITKNLFAAHDHDRVEPDDVPIELPALHAAGKAA